MPEVQAQHAQEQFGKNRVQYRQYTWNYVSSEHFDLYYYDDRKKLAVQLLQYIEGKFEDIVNRIGYEPYTKSMLFLYSSVTDLQQSNIGLYDEFNVGEDEKFHNRAAYIVHQGSLDEVKRQMVYKVTELMVNEIMFGRGLKKVFRSSLLLSLPDWYISGLSGYIANGWSAEMDDYMRQLFFAKRVRRIEAFRGEEARWVGQSIWNYIAERYGEGTISNLLNYTRVISNVRKSITVMLGVNFKQFVDDWYQFYARMGQRVQQDYTFPEDSTRITHQYNRSVIYTALKISPDGTKLAYTENDRGRFVVKVRSLNGRGGHTTILRGGNRLFDQEADYNIPLVDWVNQNQLGVIGVKRGAYYFWLYDLKTRNKLSRKLSRFNNIRSIDFSSNGRLFVMSADRDGQNDLFLGSTRRDRIRRLTRDTYDDLDAAFLPDTQSIVFSSNRTTDTIDAVVNNIERIPDNYNLYLYDLDTTTRTVAKITNAVGKNYQPHAYDRRTIYYVSDQRGISNLFKYDLDTDIYTQVTSFNSGINMYDLDFTGNRLAIAMRKKLRTAIFVIPRFNYTIPSFKPATPRITSRQTKAIIKKHKAQINKRYSSIKELVNARLKDMQSESPSAVPHIDSLEMDTAVFVPSGALKPSSEGKTETDTTINTGNYVFEDDVPEKDKSSELFLARYMKAEQKKAIQGPTLYKPTFTYNDMVVDLLIDPLFGYGMSIETQMNDILENYRFFGGVQFGFDMESGGFFAEAQYLPYRVDYNVRIERKALLWGGTSNLQKYSWQKMELGVSLPFSVRWRIAAKPFLGYTNYIDRGINQPPLPTPPIFKPSEQQFYAGAKIELIYDNSLVTGLNIIEGTRGKINFITYTGLGNEGADFSHVFADIRHYQRIYKEMVFALRGYVGTFFGRAPKQYVLGGMDNWMIGSATEKGGNKSPLARLEGFNYDLIFTEFATGMRGFNYSTMHGNNVILANIELRIPLIRLLSTGPVSSKFLKNIQFIGFYDIGTSWSGAFSSFSEPSATRTVPDGVTGNPFRIDVVDQLNPWIYSYGAGLRAKIFGFYTKFDLAWPVQNYQRGRPKFYVTLGLDF